MTDLVANLLRTARQLADEAWRIDQNEISWVQSECSVYVRRLRDAISDFDMRGTLVVDQLRAEVRRLDAVRRDVIEDNMVLIKKLAGAEEDLIRVRRVEAALRSSTTAEHFYERLEETKNDLGRVESLLERSERVRSQQTATFDAQFLSMIEQRNAWAGRAEKAEAEIQDTWDAIGGRHPDGRTLCDAMPSVREAGVTEAIEWATSQASTTAGFILSGARAAIVRFASKASQDHHLYKLGGIEKELRDLAKKVREIRDEDGVEEWWGLERAADILHEKILPPKEKA